jgi:deoxyribodipyrimidine photolyase-related protein
MCKTAIIFPHQLFEQNKLLASCNTIYLVEEFLFFSQFNFHKQKIAFHRASMKFYESYLQSIGKNVVYIDAKNELAETGMLIQHLKDNNINTFDYIDTTDNWLGQRISKACKDHNIQSVKWHSHLFLNLPEENAAYFSNKKRMFQTDFYKHQRKKLNILMDSQQTPVGGKWTFDDENRLKYPKNKTPPIVKFPEPNKLYAEAATYVEKHFANNVGNLNKHFIFPGTHTESKKWMQTFLSSRFYAFGPYEDAIVSEESILHHSMLTPMLNVGLITPAEVIRATLQYADEHSIPINSLEGFIRQLIGWREYIRAVYEIKGTEGRTTNYWGFTRKIPASFWDGTTGIEPLDITIRKVLKTAYCHHIERLMVLGNFMLLCEFDPDEVYRWFMEMFVDAYDWVMVPNVYGMSQFADGGIMSTKPYISGSNYLMKMSNFKKGEWQLVWDGLFWRFLHVHREFFLQNPRLGMLIRSFDKMPTQKQQMHIQNAEQFLNAL